MKEKTRKYSEKYTHPIYEFRFKKIAAKYIKRTFLIDVIACLPLIIYEALDAFNFSDKTTLRYIDSEYYWYIFCLSLLRISMIPKILESLMSIFDKLQDRYFTKRILIENLKNISISLYQLLFMLHLSACFWMKIHYSKYGGESNQYLDELREALHD